MDFLIKKCEDIRIKYCNDPNAFVACSDTMDDVSQNIDDYSPSRRKN